VRCHRQANRGREELLDIAAVSNADSALVASLPRAEGARYEKSRFIVDMARFSLLVSAWKNGGAELQKNFIFGESRYVGNSGGNADGVVTIAAQLLYVVKLHLY
jgi:hypothetical protein